MKRVCIIFLLSIIISLTAFAFSQGKTDFTGMETGRYLRIHIRADSNDNAAQAVKYEVKDSVVEYLTPLVAEFKTKAEAETGIEKRLEQIAEVATNVLRKKGFSYAATANIEKENFPTRVYGDFTLPAGEYSALIIRLGSGKGDNWWCVVYPPLCFAATDTNVVYKSKIYEIIQSFKG